MDKRCLLIGEGREEVRFFSWLIHQIGLARDFHIEPYEGKNRLRFYLSALKNKPAIRNLEFLLVTRDADANPASAFQSVVDALQSHGFAAPQEPGTFASGNPHVGVFILPDGKKEGALEDLCLKSVEADRAMPCVEDFFECLRENSVEQSSPTKARVHAFLASRPDPDLRLGEAAEKGYWDFDHAAFNGLKEFFTRCARGG